MELKVLLQEGWCHHPFADEENEAQGRREFTTATGKWKGEAQILAQVHSLLSDVIWQT